jgi:Tol biopolymer transport system component
VKERLITAAIAFALAGAAGCAGSSGEGTPPTPEGRELDGTRPVVWGEPIDVADLSGRIVFDDFEDVYTAKADGTGIHRVSRDAGPEFDGALSPDGACIVYRDSRRGINEDDEIYVARSDGSGARNITRHPANDWGPDWSPDGRTIVFNSDRDGGVMSGYLVSADGSDLRRIDADVWIEYPSFSPDGEQIAFMGHEGGDYDIYVADLETGAATRLTDAPGSDGWPAWSPDRSKIAFATQRDDCVHAQANAACWVDPGAEPGEHHDIWLMDQDGSSQRRVTPEFGQFVTWSPDGEQLLVSGYSLYVIRPDGSGRADVLPRAGGIPDWVVHGDR